jgi:DNA-binding NarL/FixJ family response regulator
MGGSAPTASRIVLVDDHHIVRSGLKALIETAHDLVVVGEGATAADGLRVALEELPDLVITDVRLPDRSGIAVCRDVTTRLRETKVLVLTSYADEDALFSAVVAGASGYLLKRVGTTDLLGAIRRILGGETVFDHDWAPVEPDPVLSSLSPQERVVASYLAEGLTNRKIAEAMGLAEKTVKNYVSSLLNKMGMARRSEAAAYVARVETSNTSSLVTSEMGA